MKETTYNESDLEHGKCTCCEDKCLIVPHEGKCPDCIEDIAFFEAAS